MGASGRMTTCSARRSQCYWSARWAGAASERESVHRWRRIDPELWNGVAILAARNIARGYDADTYGPNNKVSTPRRAR